MIVITGPGRSGTSFLAGLAQDLGFEPGGAWSDDVSAGFEAPDVVRLNDTLIEELGLTLMGERVGAGTGVRRASRRYVPAAIRRALRERAGSAVSTDRPSWLRWDQFDAVVERHGPALRELGAAHPLVKDPRFSWTLGAWAAAGVSIEHVLVTVRSVDAMVESRQRAGHLRFRGSEGAKNGFIYALGLCIAALHDHRIPHDIVRFPDFLDDPRGLHERMRFPAPVEYERFEDAFERRRSDRLIHDRR